jgi:hypothetical protein
MSGCTYLLGTKSFLKVITNVPMRFMLKISNISNAVWTMRIHSVIDEFVVKQLP